MFKEEYWCSECNDYVGGIKPTSLTEAKCPVCKNTGLRLFNDDGPSTFERMYENVLEGEIENIIKETLVNAAEIIVDSKKNSWVLSAAQDKAIEEQSIRSRDYQMRYGNEYYNVLEIPSFWEYVKLCNIDLGKTSQSQFDDLIKSYLETSKTYLDIARNTIIARNSLASLMLLLFFYFAFSDGTASTISLIFVIVGLSFSLLFIKPQVILTLLGRRKFVRE